MNAKNSPKLREFVIEIVGNGAGLRLALATDSIRWTVLEERGAAWFRVSSSEDEAQARQVIAEKLRK